MAPVVWHLGCALLVDATNLRGVQHLSSNRQELCHTPIYRYDEVGDSSVGGVGRTTVIAAHGTLNDSEPFHFNKKVIERLEAMVPRF